MWMRRALGAAMLLAGTLGGDVASVQAGAADAPLPGFGDGKPGLLAQLLSTVVKTNNVDTDVICTNLGSAPVDVGLELFDETGAKRNDVSSGADGVDVKLNLPVGATVTLGTGTSNVLHEDLVVRLNNAGNGINSLRSGSGRVVASATGVRCIALAVDTLHAAQDPAGCPNCKPPSFTLLSDAGCSPEQCDDHNPCTTDTCDGSGTCRHTPANDVTCDDGDLCTTGDVCHAGVCAGTPVVCGLEAPCSQTATCNPADGSCVDTTPFSTCAAGGGGDPTTDCTAESVIDNPSNSFGVTNDVQSCAQGDGACDFDISRKRCTFHVRVCLNNHDVTLPSCTPAGTATYELKGTVAGAIRKTILDAVGALAPSTRGGKSRRRVTFTAPVTDTDQCTDRLAIPVSLGKAVSLKVVSTTATGSLDTDKLKLRCGKPRKK